MRGGASVSGINWRRVWLGGLAAGLLSNVLGITGAVLLFAEHAEELHRRMGTTMGPGEGALHVALRFVLGLGVVWLYAAIRPRMGAGPRTASLAGLFLWLFTFVFSLAVTAPLKLHPPQVMALLGAWSLMEMQAVALLGAWMYRE